jgi:hypothetical protein
MDKVIQEPAKILTEEELHEAIKKMAKRNSMLVLENDELLAENMKLKEKDEKVNEFVDWDKYHAYLKTLEEINHE